MRNITTHTVDVTVSISRNPMKQWFYCGLVRVYHFRYYYKNAIVYIVYYVIVIISIDDSANDKDR